MGTLNLKGLLYTLAQLLGLDPLFLGMLIGGLVVVVVGQIFFVMRRWSNTVKAAYRPQTAFTAKTPAQVVEASRSARAKLTCCQFVIAVGVIVAALLYFGWLDEVWAALWALLRGILGLP
ncbi:MAG TPA: hypothetical protein ENK08_06305 [Chloroflexi bacterium]|nr:hypothetical protein [Chloroflexota bacterium]